VEGITIPEDYVVHRLNTATVLSSIPSQLVMHQTQSVLRTARVFLTEPLTVKSSTSIGKHLRQRHRKLHKRVYSANAGPKILHLYILLDLTIYPVSVDSEDRVQSVP